MWFEKKNADFRGFRVFNFALYLKSKTWKTRKIFVYFKFLSFRLYQFVIFKPLSYCFEEAIGFDVKASFASRPESRLIRWYNEPGDITKEFW